MGCLIVTMSIDRLGGKGKLKLGNGIESFSKSSVAISEFFAITIYFLIS